MTEPLGRESGSQPITLTDGERAILHAGVCRAHGDTVPGVYVCAPCERAGDDAAARIIAERLAATAPIIGEQRCRDIHPGIWNPGAWAYADRTCPACTSWGEHVARLLTAATPTGDPARCGTCGGAYGPECPPHQVTAPSPTNPPRADPAATYTDPTETEGGA